MPTLHLGEIDQPYGNAGAKTTGEVGEILEAKYGLYSAFVEIHAPVIVHEIENSIEGTLETMFMQRRPDFDRLRANVFQAAMSPIEELFRDAIDMQSYDNKLPGVPTGAALMGIRHSLKRPRSRRIAKVRGGKTIGGPRPSFFDTGLLSSSFRAWVD
jgi:hypothetical protein